METARQKHKRSRKSTSRHKPRTSNKRPEVSSNGESAQAEGFDRLLLSSLKYWEVERDLIEERLEARGS